MVKKSSLGAAFNFIPQIVNRFLDTLSKNAEQKNVLFYFGLLTTVSVVIYLFFLLLCVYFQSMNCDNALECIRYSHITGITLFIADGVCLIILFMIERITKPKTTNQTTIQGTRKKLPSNTKKKKLAKRPNKNYPHKIKNPK